MPPVQSALAQVGLASQAVKGTPTANPTYAFGVTGGPVIVANTDQAISDLTSSKRNSSYVDLSTRQTGFDISTRAFTRTIGLLMYTHTITPANTLPLLTTWGSLDSTVFAVQDCMVDTLELSWDGTKPVEVKASGMGTTMNFAPTFTPGTDETGASFLLPIGGTFKLDVASSTPVTAKITGGSVKINNNLADRTLSGSVVPDEVFPGRQEIEASVKLLPDNLLDWRAAYTGATGGTTAQQSPVYGSYEFTFVDGTSSLKLQALRTSFIIPFPDANPSGGPTEVDASGLTIVQSGGGAALTATLINGVTSY
jgi:hypothetical protein